MAHVRKPLLYATALNTGIVGIEAFAGYQANSLSLLMDSVHNLSDELALVCLCLAYLLPLRLSRNLQNVFSESNNYFREFPKLASKCGIQNGNFLRVLRG